MDNKALADFIRYELSKVISALNKLTLKINGPRKDGETTVRPQQTSADANQQPQIPVLAVSPAPAHANETRTQTKKSQPRRSRIRRVWRQSKRIFFKKDRLERAAFLAGIVYAVVTVVEWRDLRHNFEIDQRAWIQIAQGLPATVTEDIVVDRMPITLKNVGKNPAFQTLVDAQFNIVDADKPPSFSFESMHSIARQSLLFPQEATPEGIPVLFRSPTGEARKISVEEIRRLIAGTAYLVIFSRAFYVDSFGTHWTRACSWKDYSPLPNKTYQADYCVAWSAVGDGVPPVAK